MNPELIVWGLPQGQTDPLHEHILSTQCRTRADVDRIKALARADGWHSFRVQRIDGRVPNFAATVNRTRQKST